MMLNRSQENEKDALFAAWCDERETGRARPLLEWIDAYPQYRDDLTLWAASSYLLEDTLEFPADPAAEERAYQVMHDTALAKIAEINGRASAHSSPSEPDKPQAAEAREALQADLPNFRSLRAVAAERGLKLKQLATALRLALSVVTKLDQRLIQASTLPPSLIESLADCLNRSVEEVRTYLQAPPTLAAGVLYQADSAPTAAGPQEFAAALQAATDLLEDDRQFWLSQIPE